MNGNIGQGLGMKFDCVASNLGMTTFKQLVQLGVCPPSYNVQMIPCIHNKAQMKIKLYELAIKACLQILRIMRKQL